MKVCQAEKLREWFFEYIQDFYGIDEFVDANIELKEEHSKRVCAEMNYITGELGLNDDQKRLAEVIGFLHDVGRFEQFKRYRTYNDPRSVNHSALGVEILDKAGVLTELDADDREIIRTAIRNHGIKMLPQVGNGQEMYCKLIRDADKVDIYYVVTEYYRRYRENPAEFKLEVELPDTEEYSQVVVDCVMAQRPVDYKDLKTWNDMKILQLGWVYDVNFEPSLRRIHEQGYLDKVFEFLPDDETIGEVRRKVMGYVENRLSNGN